MRTVKVCMLTALAFAAASCAKPMLLRIEAPIPQPAQASLRLVWNSAGEASPDQSCQTPCSVEIAPDAKYELTVRAQDYYPVHIERLTYEQVDRAKPTVLVVPMLRRPTRQEPVVAPE